MPKKCVKVFIIILVILIMIILVDTIQAKIFDNRPFIKIIEKYAPPDEIAVDLPEENSLENMESNIERENTMDFNVKVVINNEAYNAILEENETTKSFIDMLPQEYNMSELNGNEKYIYLDKTLPTNSYNPKHIEKGDIMLYGNNCLVVFYKSFDTQYSYTKIGHIGNLPDLGNDSVIVKFEN